MPRLASRGLVVALLLGSILAAVGCGGRAATEAPIDRGQDPALQKAMGDYMNNINKPQAKQK
jgi:hypothetical protein